MTENLRNEVECVRIVFNDGRPPIEYKDVVVVTIVEGWFKVGLAETDDEEMLTHVMMFPARGISSAEQWVEKRLEVVPDEATESAQ